MMTTLIWNPCRPSPPPPPPSLSLLVSSPLSFLLPSFSNPNKNPTTRPLIISACEELTARGRRQLRKERRRTATNWREEVEERLMKKKPPKKKYASWTEELNLDNLALLGPQWWVVRVSRTSALSMADQLARALARNFPALDFKVWYTLFALIHLLSFLLLLLLHFCNQINILIFLFL